MNNFDEIFERAFRNPFSLLNDTRPSLGARDWYQPSFDVEENEEAFLLSLDVPGVKKEDLKIDVSENVMTITGERKQGDRVHGHFQRSFSLPRLVEVSKVEADMEDGVLRILLPKSEASKPRSIEVKSGKSGFLSRLISSRQPEQKEVKEARGA